MYLYNSATHTKEEFRTHTPGPSRYNNSQSNSATIGKSMPRSSGKRGTVTGCKPSCGVRQKVRPGARGMWKPAALACVTGCK